MTNTIPTDWKQIKIKEIFEVKSGLGFKANEYTPKGVRLLQIENVGYGHVKWKNIINLPEEYLKDYPELHLRKGDIVIALNRPVTNNKLKIAMLKEEDEPSILYQRVGKIIPKDRVVNKNYLYQISKTFLKTFVLNQSIGSDQPYIAMKDLYRYSLPIAPLPEQHRIVAVLETWDKAIESLTRKIELKKNIKKGLMQELLTGKRRLAGFSGEWEIVNLGDVCDFYNGFAFKSSTYVEKGIYKILTIANVQDGKMKIEGAKEINNLPEKIREHQILKVGDMLISMTGNVGRVCLVSSKNCLLNQRVGKIVPKGIDGNLLFFQLLSPRFLSEMIDAAQGGAQGNISVGDIKSYQFKIPESKKEQTAIAHILTTADDEITALQKKKQIIEDQKKYLLNNLITGQIRTPENLIIPKSC